VRRLDPNVALQAVRILVATLETADWTVEPTTTTAVDELRVRYPLERRPGASVMSAQNLSMPGPTRSERGPASDRRDGSGTVTTNASGSQRTRPKSASILFVSPAEGLPWETRHNGRHRLARRMNLDPHVD
jgi:hypothetical protein